MSRPRVVVSGRFDRWPRAVTVCLGAAIVRSAWAALGGEGIDGAINSIDWVLLALAEMVLLAVVLHAPAMFQVRRFRLAGVAVAANSVLILFPLPEVVEIYEHFVPSAMVLSIAAAVFTMAVVFLAMSKWAVSRPPVTTEIHLSGERALPTGVIVATLIVIPVWFAVAGLPPLFSILGSNAGDLALDRQAAFSRLEFPAFRLILGVLRNLLIMFAAGWFVAATSITPKLAWRQRSVAEATALAVVGLGAFFAVLTTERAILGELLVVCTVSYLVARSRELTLPLVGWLAGAAAIFPFAVGFLSGAAGALGVIQGLKRRLLFLPTEVMTRYFIEFPQQHDFLWGAAVPKLSFLTGGEPFDLSRHIYDNYYARLQGSEGNANGSLFGVGWANFGPVGVVVWGALLAAGLVLIDRWLDLLPRRSGAALRGLGVVMAILTTSVDLFRSVLGFAPGYLDLLIVVSIVTWVGKRRRGLRRGVDRRVGSQSAQLGSGSADEVVADTSATF